MKGLNKITIIEHPGKEPETLILEGATGMATIRFGTFESNKVHRASMPTETDWHWPGTWRNLAKEARKYLKKRSPFYLIEKLKTNNNEDNSSVKNYPTEILTGKIILLDRPLSCPSDVTDIYESLGELRKQASYASCYDGRPC